MAAKSTPSTIPAPYPEPSLNIFQDEARLAGVKSGDANTENLDPTHAERGKHVLNIGKKSTVRDGPASSVGRAPLADVTQEVVSHPRSLSSALAEIANLEHKLEDLKGRNEALKAKNRKLKGAIVAYQDALYQADVDAGYL
ncbi:hypothetical protein SVAN01_00591 [Stagonosporopsis vannaccii]|nr:hypothetical protein SVAN01_00591 [Stagonosporopsis vannaccii]